MPAIYIPENKVLRVVALIRRGLKDEKDAEVKAEVERQCKELEKRWRRPVK